MSREIRRVPPTWEHPRKPCIHSPWAGGCSDAKAHGGECFHPLNDEDFVTAARRWMDDCLAWDAGTHPDAAKYKSEYPFFWQWDTTPPDEEYYRPAWTEAEATAYQMYETVSEGTPVSPVFPTLVALEDWLVNDAHYSREAAHAFTKSGWAPSGVFTGGKFYSNLDALVAIDHDEQGGSSTPQGAAK